MGNTDKDKPPKGLICWDVDGVLLQAPNENHDWRKILTPRERALYRATVEAPEWQACLCGKLDVGLLLEAKAVELGHNELEMAHVLSAWHDETFLPNESAFSLLKAMYQQGWKTIIASNQDTERALWLQTRMGLDSYVDVWAFSCQLGMAKPDAAFYHKLQTHSVSPELPCIFIDDVEANLDVPKAMGWKTHLFTSSASLQKFLEAL